jgi:O-antigen/teichoic acid export membrane protein
MTGAADQARGIARGSALILSAEGVAGVSALAVLIYLARALGPDRFGLYSLAFTVVTLLEWTVAAFFNRATVKMISGRGTDAGMPSTVLVIQLASAILLAFAQFALAGLLERRFAADGLGVLLRLSALEIPLFVTAQTLRSFHVGRSRYQRRALVTSVKAIARLVLTVSLVYLGWGIEGAIIASILATVLELVFSGWGIRIDRTASAAEIWKFGVPTFVFAICMRLLERLDLILLKALGATAAAVGAYSASQLGQRLAIMVAAAVSPLVLGSVNRLMAARLRDDSRKLTTEAIRGALLLFPFACIAAAVAGELVTLLFSSTYAGTAVPATFLFLGGWATFAVYISSAIATAHDRPSIPAGIVAVAVALALIGYWAAIPRLATVGAAVVTAGALMLSAIASLIAAARLAGTPVPLRLGFAVAVIGSGSFIALRWIDLEGSPALMMAGVGSLVCIVIYYVTRMVTRADLLRIRRLISS